MALSLPTMVFSYAPVAPRASVSMAMLIGIPMLIRLPTLTLKSNCIPIYDKPPIPSFRSFWGELATALMTLV